MSDNQLLNLLINQGRLSDERLAELLKMSPQEVKSQIEELEASGAIVGFQAVVNRDLVKHTRVSAFIEVKMTPERQGGFDRTANRIARFDQVVSCYLSSGGYDLLVIVEGDDLREVARFVSEKLSTIGGVLSTATHFRLKTYKENGFLFAKDLPEDRLSVSP